MESDRPPLSEISGSAPVILPKLHAFKMLFYAESVGVVTSGNVTKIAVTPFDPQWPINPCYTQTSRLYLSQNWSYCRLKFYMTGIGNFAFLRKIVEIITKFFSHPKKGVTVAETHFLTHYRPFQLVCCRCYTHSKCCFTPNRWAWAWSLGAQ